MSARVRPNVWTNPKFRRMSDEDRLLALYLMTCPHANTAGYYRVTVPDVADGLRRADVAAVRASFLLVVSTFEWHYDTDAAVLWVPTWFKYNPPRVLSQLRSAIAEARAVHEAAPSLLWVRFVEETPAAIKRAWHGWWRDATVDHGTTSERRSEPSLAPLPSPRTPLPTPHSHPWGAPTDPGLDFGDQDLALQPSGAIVQISGPDVVRVYAAEWRERYGASPVIVSQDAGMAKAIAERLGARALDVVRAFVRSNDPWLVERRHTFNHLTWHRVNQILAAATPARVSTVAAGVGAWRTRRHAG